MSKARDHLPAGTLVDGKYRVVRLLGRGGMGEVYEVENVKVKRLAALKLLKASSSADIVSRFEAEAQAAGRAGSRRIVDVLDLGRTPEGLPYMVLELLEGETLRDELRRARQMSPRRAATLLADTLLGIEAAHIAGIVHRDLKPENIFVLAPDAATSRVTTGDQPLVKVLDFGVSKFATQEGEGRPGTAAGVMIGTCWYMSPEQILDARASDARSDLYAVGVMLYELLTGSVPFPGSSLQQTVYKIITDLPVDPRKVLPSIPDSLADITLRALEKEPASRFQSAAEMREHLTAFLEERPALQLELGTLDVPARPAIAATLANEPAAPTDIELEAPSRPHTPSVWKSMLSSKPPTGDGDTLPAGTPPRLTEPAATPVPSSGHGREAPASDRQPPTPGPASPRPPATAAGDTAPTEAGPPPSLPTPDPSSERPRSSRRGGFTPAAISLVDVMPRRTGPTQQDAWPRPPLLVGAAATLVMVVSLAVGVLYRFDVLGG